MQSAYPKDQELLEVLKLVLDELNKKGLLKNVPDPKALIEETLENIKEGLSPASLSRASLEDPAMKLKLATSLIATFTKQKTGHEFDFKTLFDPDKELALKKELPAMMNKFLKAEPTEAKALVALTNTLEMESPSPASAPTPSPKSQAKGGEDKKESELTEKERSVFQAVFSDDGTLLDVLEGVGVSSKDVSKSVITLSEMLSSDLVPELREKLEESDFLKDMHLNSPKLTLSRD